MRQMLCVKVGNLDCRKCIIIDAHCESVNWWILISLGHSFLCKKTVIAVDLS